MGLFIFGIICAVVGLLLILIHRITVDGDTVRLRVWGVAILVLAAIPLLLSCVKSVGAREVGIPVRFGKIGVDLQAGVHFLAPWVVIHSCSLGQQQSIMSESPTEGDRQGNDGVNINGNDQGGGVADVSILYHFSPTQANHLYRLYACNPDLIKNNLIRQVTKGAVGTASAQYASTDLKNHRGDISTRAEQQITPILAQDGIVVDNIVIAQITLSQAAQQAADTKLAAQQAALQAQFALQKAQVDRQTALVQGQAEQAANAAKTASLTPQILCQQWIQAIQASHITVLTTGGPCGGGSGGSGVIAQVPAS